MFATRADQENLAYSHQAAAAAKPLNQTKTPGNKTSKTPFRGNKQDENNVFLGGKTGLKTGGKAKQNLFTDAKKGTDFGNDAFVTPAGPRTRAPLGMKTTNAKGNALQTPAPQTNSKGSAKSTQKPVSPRLRRAKVKIHQAEPVAIGAELEEPDIEYMPPRSVPLPDFPDDLHDIDYSAIFKPENMAGDLWNHFRDPIGRDGKHKSERDYEELMSRTDKIQERKIREALQANPLFRDDISPVKQSRGPITTPSTLSSRSAAAVLARPAQPRFAAPTAATKAKVPSGPLSRKPANANHAVATVASKSTLGYSKGRAVSASARKPISEAHRAEVVRRPAAPQLEQQQQQAKQPQTALEYLLQDDAKVRESLRQDAVQSAELDEAERELQDEMDRLALAEDDGLKDFEVEVPTF